MNLIGSDPASSAAPAEEDNKPEAEVVHAKPLTEVPVHSTAPMQPENMFGCIPLNFLTWCDPPLETEAHPMKSLE